MSFEAQVSPEKSAAATAFSQSIVIHVIIKSVCPMESIPRSYLLVPQPSNGV